jgi:uncharacterized protein
MKKRLFLTINAFVLLIVGVRWWRRARRSVEHGILIRMNDGVLLCADHYYSSNTERGPTILIRSPYGRNLRAGVFGGLVAFIARYFAARGYHVLTQDVRGRFDSQGEFEPYFHERSDGQATIAWLKQQPWFNGSLGMWGSSYLGIVQWAIADAPELQALVPGVTTSDLYDVVFPDGALDLGLMMRWTALLRIQERYTGWRALLSLLLLPEMERAVRPTFNHLPLQSADARLPGGAVDYYRRWLEQAEHDPEWKTTLQGIDPAKVNAPVHLIGGWYDFFLRGLLRDYAALQAAGKAPYLTIGPWHHFSHFFLMLVMIKPGLAWFASQLKGEKNHLRKKPVRLYIMGANKWRDYDIYPPPSTEQRFYLGRDKTLTEASTSSSPDHYSYDPANPTPVVGGTQFSLYAGARDNRSLERRADVLSYTTSPLQKSLEIIGPVHVELYVSSSLESTDFFGRLCDVYPDGRSINVCDGLFRIETVSEERQADGSLCIKIDLWATAYQFQAGHSVRLLIASGAHPRWSRNLGGPSPLTDIILQRAEQTIYHDRQHPSALVLPVLSPLL